MFGDRFAPALSSINPFRIGLQPEAGRVEFGHVQPKPTFRNHCGSRNIPRQALHSRLRYPVETLLEYLAGGDTIEDLLKEFPDLEREDILACHEFGENRGLGLYR